MRMAGRNPEVGRYWRLSETPGLAGINASTKDAREFNGQCLEDDGMCEGHRNILNIEKSRRRSRSQSGPWNGGAIDRQMHCAKKNARKGEL